MIDNENINDSEVEIEDSPEQIALSKVILDIVPNSLPQIQSEDVEDIAELVLTPEQREQSRLARKPSIEHLKNGVIIKSGERIPMFDVGDRIVVERYASLVVGCPWLDTLVYHVVSIDDELGYVRVTEEESRRQGYVSFKDKYTTIKLAPVRGNPFENKRGRKRSSVMKKIIEAQVKKDEELQVEKNKDSFAGKNVEAKKKSGRGRPKGAKNRSKEEITADKKVRLEKMRAKREKKAKRGKKV